MSGTEKPKIIFSLPCHEVATCAWSNVAKNVIPQFLQGKNVDYRILYGNEATAANIYRALQESNVKAFGGVGHGSNWLFTAQNYEVVFWTAWPDKAAYLRGKAFAPVSCLVGVQLVPWLVQQGVPAGVGEVTEYYITSNGILSFVRADTVFWVRLALGDTVERAFRVSLDTYEEEAQERERQGDTITARFLRADAQNRRLFGDKNWKMVEAPQPPQPPQPSQPPQWEEWEVELTVPQSVLKGRVRVKKV